MFRRKLIQNLKNTINNLEKEKQELKMSIESRDLALKDYQEEHTILLENAAKLRSKIIDLENNIELLVNNSTDKKIREIVDTPKSNYFN